MGSEVCSAGYHPFPLLDVLSALLHPTLPGLVALFRLSWQTSMSLGFHLASINGDPQEIPGTKQFKVRVYVLLDTSLPSKSVGLHFLKLVVASPEVTLFTRFAASLGTIFFPYLFRSRHGNRSLFPAVGAAPFFTDSWNSVHTFICFLYQVVLKLFQCKCVILEFWLV